MRVFYGHDKLPGKEEPASGGIVKCQDLVTEFPNNPSDPNVLYLVSSALPKCPEVMVKYALDKRAKLVVNQNGVAIPAYHGQNCELINRPRRNILLQADFVIYQSVFCRKSSDIYLTDKVLRSRVLYNPVDTSVFIPDSHSINGKVPVILLAGSHCHKYRVFSAVKIVKEMISRGANVQLHIAGRLVWAGDQQQCLSELTKFVDENCLNDHVLFSGPYLQKNAVSLMQSTDILLHTKYMDPCPRLVVEALSCGLPIVCESSGGLAELVGVDAGVTVPVSEDWQKIHELPADAGADALECVLEDYKKYSQNARCRAVDKFDLKPWLKSHREILEMVCDEVSR